MPGQASDTGSIGVLSLAPNHIGGMEKLQARAPPLALPLPLPSLSPRPPAARRPARLRPRCGF